MIMFTCSIISMHHSLPCMMHGFLQYRMFIITTIVVIFFLITIIIVVAPKVHQLQLIEAMQPHLVHMGCVAEINIP